MREIIAFGLFCALAALCFDPSILGKIAAGVQNGYTQGLDNKSTNCDPVKE